MSDREPERPTEDIRPQVRAYLVRDCPFVFVVLDEQAGRRGVMSRGLDAEEVAALCGAVAERVRRFVAEEAAAPAGNCAT